MYVSVIMENRVVVRTSNPVLGQVPDNQEIQTEKKGEEYPHTELRLPKSLIS